MSRTTRAAGAGRGVEFGQVLPGSREPSCRGHRVSESCRRSRRTAKPLASAPPIAASGRLRGRSPMIRVANTHLIRGNHRERRTIRSELDWILSDELPRFSGDPGGTRQHRRTRARRHPLAGHRNSPVAPSMAERCQWDGLRRVVRGSRQIDTSNRNQLRDVSVGRRLNCANYQKRVMDIVNNERLQFNPHRRNSNIR